MNQAKRLILLFALALLACAGLHAVSGNTFGANPPLNDPPTRDSILVTVGSGDQVGLIPVNMYYRTSLFETVFPAAELNFGGLITTLRFYNNFQTSILNSATTIWLGATTIPDLSGGWIGASQLTQVFSGQVDYPSGQNEITIHLETPFAYTGGNLVLLVHRPWDDDYYMPQDLFLAQTVGATRSLTVFNNNTTINPDNPPPTGTTGQFPKITFTVQTGGMGALTGEISSAGQPLPGATVSLGGTPLQVSSDATGHYVFPYVQPGTYQATAGKTGYQPVSQTVVIVADQTASQNFSLSALAQVSISGRVVSSNNPVQGLQGVEVTLSGYADYDTVSGADGDFVFTGVYVNHSYTLNISLPGYQDYSLQINLGASNLILGDLIINELAYPPRNLVATEYPNGAAVSLVWQPPTAAQSGWLHYDSGENLTSFGTGGSLSFTVAIRFPASALEPYAGARLQAVKIWPAMGGNFAVRVWTGGDASNPGQMVLEQPIIPILNTYNTIMLSEPVLVTGAEELWFGFLCDVTGINPAYAGVDPGPAVNGFGNLIHWQGNWTTLLQVNAYCDFNWNIQGFVGLEPPSGAISLTPLPKPIQAPVYPSRSRTVGYKAYRLLQGQENNPAAWTNLTPSVIQDTTLVDHTWDQLPQGNYLWAVQAVYINSIYSDYVFSNVLTQVYEVGTLAGTVRDLNNAPLMNAQVNCAGSSATTNANGAYSLLVPSGTWSVTATHPGHQSVTVEEIVILTGQTTTLNFQLPASSPADDPGSPPVSTAFAGISPNPFRASATLSFSLREAQRASLSFYNLKGQLVRVLGGEMLPAGHHTLVWDGLDAQGRPVAPGIYLCRMRAGEFSAGRKLIRLE